MCKWGPVECPVVADTTKVRIFKQITTTSPVYRNTPSCCWYHKGTNFQANHNSMQIFTIKNRVVADTTKVRIFKQITTYAILLYDIGCCCWYHKGTNFQANHNDKFSEEIQVIVVADTTKVRIFKQITTTHSIRAGTPRLLLIPQRYEFSSKSQQLFMSLKEKLSCCWYHKGTNFQANHNRVRRLNSTLRVVADTTKVRIFKQITTVDSSASMLDWLLLIPQRYEFSSKSQLRRGTINTSLRCCWYHKGTNFQANHNDKIKPVRMPIVVADTTKVRIFKQITTVTI